MANIRHDAILKVHPDVIMDDCHIDLIHALVLAAKPISILEIGVGNGAVTKALIRAALINDNRAGITLVDGFNDWNFDRPEGFDKIENHVEFVKSQEREFIMSALANGKKYDFIVSDADHAHCGEWAEATVGIVEAGGILIYHDADSIHFPSVKRSVEIAMKAGMSAIMFNKNSHLWEQCHRGLCVLQKYGA